MFLDSKKDEERYSQAVEILEASVYSKASFETLKLLAENLQGKQRLFESNQGP